MYKGVIVACALLASAGCNTVEGIGQDLSAVGGAVTKSAAATKTGRAKVITRDPAACLPDAHGRVPAGQCTTRTASRAKAPAKQTAKASAPGPLNTSVTPVKAEATTAKATRKPKSGWW